MTEPIDRLSLCGGCKSSKSLPQHFNRPGQPHISYRLGTQSLFLRYMLSRLNQLKITSGTNAKLIPLKDLTTRNGSDPAIALLDAWAMVADVLAFYQDRIANEGYLRTATESLSVLELAREIGYELKPGVAASTYLAFTAEETRTATGAVTGAPASISVPMGTKVQSLPAPAKLPQTFETVEDLVARAEWNAFSPQKFEHQTIDLSKRRILLKGIGTLLQPGDPLFLLSEDEKNWCLLFLNSVEPHPNEDHTLVTWYAEPISDQSTINLGSSPSVFVMRQRASFFGYNAPDWRAMAPGIKKAYNGGKDPAGLVEWPDFEINETNSIFLDAVYPKILAKGWVVFMVRSPNVVARRYNIDTVSSDSCTNFALTSKVTRLEIHGKLNPCEPLFGRRKTAIFLQSEKLKIADMPLTGPVEGKEIVLDRIVSGLQKGKKLVFKGKPSKVVKSADAQPSAPDDPAKGGLVSEVALIEDLPDPKDYSGLTKIVLKDALKNEYDRSSLEIYGNVASATHGETVREVLGSGDGSQPNQIFALKKPPLTYVQAPSLSGALSTLSLRVNDVLWNEVPSLYDQEGRSQIYEVRIADDGRTTVIFGDGQSGALLPTGRENVIATYRSGIGPDGETGSDRIMLLMKRPLGIKGVTNPVPATGSALPEGLAEARANAPLTVLTMDRVVSLKDFGDFARRYAGIGKAEASEIKVGEERVVFITVGAAGGGQVSHDTIGNLLKSIEFAGEPLKQVQAASYTPRTFSLKAGVTIDPLYLASDVMPKLKDALLDAFSFEKRSFGQPVRAAEIIMIASSVKGVQAIDIDEMIENAMIVSTAEPGRLLNASNSAPELDRIDIPRRSGMPLRSSLVHRVRRVDWIKTIITAKPARLEGERVVPAELLLINPNNIELIEVT